VAEQKRSRQSDDRTRPFWQRARPSGIAPIGLLVGVAMVCIVFAVLSSAHRADLVAFDHERRLVSLALADRQAQIVSEVEHIAGSDEAFQRLWLQLDDQWVRQQIGLRLKNQLGYTLVLLVDAGSNFVYQLAGEADVAPDLTGVATLNELNPILAKLFATAPGLGRAGVFEASKSTMRPSRGVARLQRFRGQPALLAAAALSMGQRNFPAAAAMPVVLIVNFLNPSFLEHIGTRLALPHLQTTSTDEVTAEGMLALAADGRAPIGYLEWTPNRPGAEIVQNILPFICIALACFSLMAAFALRYMRRTTAAIAEGEVRMRHMAMHDPLSGLPNRTLFAERLESILDDVKEGRRRAALLSIDLDHFKDVNDTLGHHVGDCLISAVAQRLGRIVREGDLVARLGGDEFAVITGGANDPAALEDIGQRVIATLSAPYAVSGHTLVIGATIGIVAIDERSRDVADIMRFADMALYRAKNAGRNRACVYDKAMSADLTQRKRLEHDLRFAIQQDGLAVAYQPLVSPDGERMIGVEALCRWPHPRRGSVPPSEFIPVAEQSELIIPLGEWVLERACLDGGKWPDILVAVNVSPLQFRRPDFVEVVERILERTHLAPERLELELTESTLLGNVDGAENAMRRLKALGVKLALDDFGTGYSSLLYLRKFPFDKLKIDRSFVNNIETAADAAAIVHAIVGLGRGLRMKVTAEGVENAEQQLFLRAAGVHSMQGFRFGRPVEAAEITARLARQTGRPVGGPLLAAAS
jgi:diguanylate cyclase (GGDEF)-like protein